MSATGVITLKNVVGGEVLDATTGEHEDVLDPATEEVIARAPVGGAADVTGGQVHRGLQGGVAAGVEDLEAFDGCDFVHGRGPEKRVVD